MKFPFSFHKNEKRPNGTLQSVKKYYFNFTLRAAASHKIEFAKQIHKFREHVSRNLYKEEKMCP